MRKLVLACVVWVGCGHGNKSGGSDDGVIFDPCVSDPKLGFVRGARRQGDAPHNPILRANGELSQDG